MAAILSRGRGVNARYITVCQEHTVLGPSNVFTTLFFIFNETIAIGARNRSRGFRIMRAIYLPILLVMHIYAYMATPFCQQKFLKRLSGFRCIIVDPGQQIRQDDQIPDIQTQRCNYECMRHAGCSAANYKVSENTCYVNQDKCDRLTPDSAFETIYFGNMMASSDCISWVPQAEYDSTRTVIHDRCYNGNPSNPRPCHVARILSTGDILPAAFVPDPLNELLSVLNGAKHTDRLGQVLQVRPECDQIWAMFNADTDTLPLGAVKGGYLASTSSDLYVMKALNSGGWIVFGYFEPSTSLGYYIHSDVVKRVTIMMILVIL